MNTHHVAVWIDHKEAKIFHIDAETFDATTVKAPHHHLTRKADEQGAHSASKPFFDDVATALGGAEQVLLVGPSTAKLEFHRHLHTHNAALEKRIVGVETLDHPTDGQFAAYVRQYFHGKDRMAGLVP